MGSRSDASSPLPGKSDELPFEQALQRLETIVEELEAGDLALERALVVFEEGVKLTRRCAEQLDAAERRVETLLKEGGDWKVKAFDPAPED